MAAARRRKARLEVDRLKKETNRQIADLNKKLDEANAISKEMLQHQKRQGEVLLIVEPYFDSDFIKVKEGSDSEFVRAKGVPINGIIAVRIKNDGPIEARLAAITLETTRGILMQASSIEGDLEDRPIAGDLPATLRPGRQCTAYFHAWREGDFSMLPTIPDYIGSAISWTEVSRIRVDASNKEFYSQNNRALQSLKQQVHAIANLGDF